MFEVSVSKVMKKKKQRYKEISNTFMSNTNCQGIEK